jgi:tetratricopeptide (TPR) repeat protein
MRRTALLAALSAALLRPEVAGADGVPKVAVVPMGALTPREAGGLAQHLAAHLRADGRLAAEAVASGKAACQAATCAEARGRAAGAPRVLILEVARRGDDCVVTATLQHLASPGPSPSGAARGACGREALRALAERAAAPLLATLPAPPAPAASGPALTLDEAEDGPPPADTPPRPTTFKLTPAMIPGDLDALDAQVRVHPYLRSARLLAALQAELAEAEQAARATPRAAPSWRAAQEKRVWASGRVALALDADPAAAEEAGAAWQAHLQSAAALLEADPRPPRSGMVRLALALALERRGAPAEARANAGRLLREAPGTYEAGLAWATLARHLWDTDRAPLALGAYENATFGGHEYAAYAHYRAAWCAVKAGDQEAAWRALHRARNLLTGETGQSVPARTQLLEGIARALAQGAQAGAAQ